MASSARSSRVATSISTSSPTACPCVSLMARKRSRPSRRIAIRARVGRVSACSSRSWNRNRFGRPVSGSCSAWRATRSCSRSASETSVNEITTPVVRPPGPLRSRRWLAFTVTTSPVGCVSSTVTSWASSPPNSVLAASCHGERVAVLEAQLERLPPAGIVHQTLPVEAEDRARRRVGVGDPAVEVDVSSPASSVAITARSRSSFSRSSVMSSACTITRSGGDVDVRHLEPAELAVGREAEVQLAADGPALSRRRARNPRRSRASPDRSRRAGGRATAPAPPRPVRTRRGWRARARSRRRRTATCSTGPESRRTALAAGRCGMFMRTGATLTVRSGRYRSGV